MRMMCHYSFVIFTVLHTVYVTPPTRVRTSSPSGNIRYTHPPKPHSHPGHGTNVTPQHGSAPAHRAGREPGTPAREAGTLTRNAKGYSL